MPYLKSTSGQHMGRMFSVKNKALVIGRGKDCDVTIEHEQISRKHAEVRVDGARFVVRDLESRNGTRVNGEKVFGGMEKELTSGAEIFLGDTVLRFDPGTVDNPVINVPEKKSPPKRRKTGKRRRKKKTEHAVVSAAVEKRSDKEATAEKKPRRMRARRREDGDRNNGLVVAGAAAAVILVAVLALAFGAFDGTPNRPAAKPEPVAAIPADTAAPAAAPAQKAQPEQAAPQQESSESKAAAIEDIEEAGGEEVMEQEEAQGALAALTETIEEEPQETAQPATPEAAATDTKTNETPATETPATEPAVAIAPAKAKPAAAPAVKKTAPRTPAPKAKKPNYSAEDLDQAAKKPMAVLRDRIGKAVADGKEVTVMVKFGGESTRARVMAVEADKVKVRIFKFNNMETSLLWDRVAPLSLANSAAQHAPAGDAPARLAAMAIFRAAGDEPSARDVFSDLVSSGDPVVTERAKKAWGASPPVLARPASRTPRRSSRSSYTSRRRSPRKLSYQQLRKEGLRKGALNWGLAANYPDDRGIERDPHVYFADSFETSGKTDKHYSRKKMNVRTNKEAYSGSYSVVRTWRKGEHGGNTMAPLKVVEKKGEPAMIFVRAYFKFVNMDPAGSQKGYTGCKGLGIYAGKYRAGQVTNGRDGYSWAMQHFAYRKGGKLLVRCQPYTYNPSPKSPKVMIGNNPSRGRTGNYMTVASVPQEEWVCLELGIVLNTPGKHDGEGRMWLNGKVLQHMTNMRFRDVENLRPNRIRLGDWRTKSSIMCPAVMHRYADNLVVARRYIGPMKKGSRSNRRR